MKTVPYECKARETRMGDVVLLNHTKHQPVDLKYQIPTAYHTATVIKITDTEVRVFRPYVHTSDFTYTGGIIPYTGIEEFGLWPDSTVLVVQESRVEEIINTETDPERLERSGIAQRRRERSDNPQWRNKWVPPSHLRCGNTVEEVQVRCVLPEGHEGPCSRVLR